MNQSRIEAFKHAPPGTSGRAFALENKPISRRTPKRSKRFAR
jgi:hypothetical protein